MHPTALARERVRVRSETKELAASLAKKLDIDVSPERFEVRANDPGVQALRQEETIRDFLGELDSVVKTPAKKKAASNG